MAYEEPFDSDTLSLNRLPSIAAFLNAYLFIAGALVAARVGTRTGEFFGVGSGNAEQLIDLLIDWIGVDGLIEYYYGWLIYSQVFFSRGYFELGVFIFAPIGPAAGAIWFRRKFSSFRKSRHVDHAQVLISKAIEVVGMVIWCFFFGWALILFIWAWPLAAYYFVTQINTSDEGSALIQRQTQKALITVFVGFFIGLLLP